MSYSIHGQIVNLAVPDTIDERAINKGDNINLFKQHENLDLAINSANSIGCVTINMDSHSLKKDKRLMLGLLWQPFELHIFKEINLNTVGAGEGALEPPGARAGAPPPPRGGRTDPLETPPGGTPHQMGQLPPGEGGHHQHAGPASPRLDPIGGPRTLPQASQTARSTLNCFIK